MASRLRTTSCSRKPCRADPATFATNVFHDPLYKAAAGLATNLTKIKAETVYHMYRDRWPVEQPPLAAKQMIGLHRQFVLPADPVSGSPN